jgi:hypothetical protein
METNRTSLEQVRRLALLGAGLSVAGAATVLLCAIAVLGLGALASVAMAALALGAGVLSGGYGIGAGAVVPRSRPRGGTVTASTAPGLRIPQPR